ncbi:TetR/AcrR family transcriptional regulator [Paraburkholderia sp. J41]|uniref:TetR/AcrR family transcriptional regulator n=1 Tax=Paraburkholderia sp. J41 TaxID=2805433 RepID=UPI0039F50935
MPRIQRPGVPSAPPSTRKITRPTAAKTVTSRRMAPEEREKQIVEKAIEHFATHGFSGSTRELARQIGVTQPLLYRYFPSKEALIDRVYNEIYRWDPSWDALIADRTVDLQTRLTAFYQAYSRVMLTRPLIRTFIFAGLAREGINTRYLERMCERVFKPVINAIRESYGLPRATDKATHEVEMELVWSLHASIFYVGMRQWVYGMPIPDDLDAHVERQVDAFLNGTPAVLNHLTKAAGENGKQAKRRVATRPNTAPRARRKTPAQG